MTQTIAAIATAAGPAGIAVVRISGPQTPELLAAITRSPYVTAHPRRLIRVRVYAPENNEPVDDGLAVFFPGPRSFTGEDSAELHVHGGTRNVARVLDAVLRHGASPAQPGEFSQRAFVNGKLDLSQAEAIQSLIHARSETAARLARRQLDGFLAGALAQAAHPIREALARIEAAIDFPEEVGDPDPTQLRSWIHQAKQQIDGLLAGARYGRKVSEGAVVVLAGAPNAGKSSLLNRLAGRERAIVTEIPGTTRDTLEEEVVIKGIPITLIDTAGLRTTNDPVEAIGIDRAGKAIGAADLVLLVRDCTAPAPDPELLPRNPDLIVWNKTDLDPDVPADPDCPDGVEACPVSAATGAGIETLRARIGALLGAAQSGAEHELPLVTSARHQQALDNARSALQHAFESLDSAAPVDCVAVDLHDALMQLGAVTGNTAREDVIRSIFATFCLGK